ncbi:heavy-metal-associated domain-containing protein [Altererythrobacter sp. H2]|uniref:heavy-metal-associated domain-containing protein n=1 Tax=Altererythrobacter sp. H2 TaxID=3108391 RepID=UPI000BDBDD2D|nr:heavy-metal-associated domain-containing protein [Altererythrobacter sp. H2]OZA94249.1 MAG: hypothetical protein B7X57_02160 [Erythrobacter sp. 34-65-8]WRK97242.1 heavy-metal-associated domain-containing protein [Altererythrobacter sp. H2]
MAQLLLLPARARTRTLALLLGGVLLLAGLAVAWAQVEGERGIAPIASSTDIEVDEIDVDVKGDNAEDARAKGWLEAQRKAWAKLGGPAIADGQLQSMVSAIVIEREQIGPRRYIARLGVIFDRARAGGLLGGGGPVRRSAPMLLVPVTISGGTALVYERRNPWQQAWAEFQSGASPIDYVRPSGAGGDSLLVTFGQTSRRSRTWWRNILDQFGAADVLVPMAHLRHAYPGGPVTGTFTARYGPDNDYLGSFTLTAKGPEELPEMLEQAVRRFDRMFGQALADGKLRPDPTLSMAGAEIDPALQRLIEIGRQIEAQERAAAAQPGADETAGDGTDAPQVPVETPQVVSAFVVQFATPDAGAFDATLAAVRGAPGVRGAATTSVGIGGTSVMTVSYGGSIDQLAAALRGRGFTVTQGSNALAIRR